MARAEEDPHRQVLGRRVGGVPQGHQHASLERPHALEERVVVGLLFEVDGESRLAEAAGDRRNAGEALSVDEAGVAASEVLRLHPLGVALLLAEEDPDRTAAADLVAERADEVAVRDLRALDVEVREFVHADVALAAVLRQHLERRDVGDEVEVRARDDDVRNLAEQLVLDRDLLADPVEPLRIRRLAADRAGRTRRRVAPGTLALVHLRAARELPRRGVTAQEALEPRAADAVGVPAVGVDLLTRVADAPTVRATARVVRRGDRGVEPVVAGVALAARALDRLHRRGRRCRRLARRGFGDERGECEQRDGGAATCQSHRATSGRILPAAETDRRGAGIKTGGIASRRRPSLDLIENDYWSYQAFSGSFVFSCTYAAPFLSIAS